MERQEVQEGILLLLQGNNASTGDGIGYTLLEIKEFLKLNNVKEYSEEKEGWKNLKNLLSEMEEKGLIEERHFDNTLGGRVDYSIENMGIEIIEKKGKVLKNKWKLPE